MNQERLKYLKSLGTLNQSQAMELHFLLNEEAEPIKVSKEEVVVVKAKKK
jgi:hypothetical protein